MKHVLVISWLTMAVLGFSAFGCRKETADNVNVNAVNNALGVVQNYPALTNQTNAAVNTTRQAQSTTEQELRQLALSFTERYGSYSNQTDFANLENLLVFMTDDFAGATRSFVASERSKNRDTVVYYGITTKAAAAQTEAFRESQGTAVFLVQTLRREAIGATNNARSYQQSLRITMKKSDGVWKVDAADWQ